MEIYENSGKMIVKFKYPEGATPLEPDELKDLVPTHITTQEQLNAWEQANILMALRWAKRKKNIISIDFIKNVHKHMFNETWKWAGNFRRSEKNIGIDWHKIPVELQKLCDDTAYQLKHHSFSSDEIAVRFHHRLVWIHPFPNGNGRHARLMADLLIVQQRKPPFSWGMHQDLTQSSDIRKEYIKALKEADHGDYKALMLFARS